MFDGTDPKKLWTFLVQCELVYSDRPKAFRMDRAKITFAQSYLKGMALEWFEPDLLDTGDPANRPHWMDNWVAFVAELQSTFGPHNPVADAEHQLDHLQMKDGHRVTRYIVDFNQLASQVRGYGDGAPKPSNSGGNSSKSGQEKSKPGNTTSSASTSGSSKPANRPASSSTRPDLTAKLGKDGKLTADERKRRLDNNLCMFCGGTGHFANKCHKKAKQAKACTMAAASSISKLTHALYSLYSKLQLITARFPVLQTCTANRQKNWPINLT